MTSEPRRIAVVGRDRVVVVQGDRIAAVGREVPRDAERVDVDGFLVPGFTDAHVHFPSWAVAREELDLVGTRGPGEVVERVRAALDGTPLRGRGWRDAGWSEAPHRTQLDAVCGEVPVALRSHDGHSLWLSSAALARGEVRGEVVERDPDGTPTGVLREEACWDFWDRFVLPDEAETLAAMRRALRACADRGVVAVHDKDGGRGAPELFAALGDELTLRVWQSRPAGEGGERDYVKAFMDGALGSRTAWLLDGSGVALLDADGLAAVIEEAAAARLPVAVHAIGDRANREALDAFERTKPLWAPLGLRHRIEHAQCVAPEDVPRFASIGVAASVQFTHATSDRDLADALWADRIDHAYPFRSLLEAGVVLAGGSDAPVEELDPLAGLRAAVLRTDDDRPAWRPEQAIDAAAALHSFTAAPAWLEGAERSRGALEPGLAADLVVLSHDPLGSGLGEARVLATMVAGHWVSSDAPA